MKRYFCTKLKKMYDDEKEIFIEKQNIVFIEMNKSDGNIEYCTNTIKDYFQDYKPFGIEEISMEEYQVIKKDSSTRSYELSKIQLKDK